MTRDQIIALELFSSDSYLTINKRLIQKVGPNTACFFSNLVDKFKYFQRAGKLQKDGSFFLTHEDQSEQLGLSKHQIRQCKEKLKELGIIQTQMHGIPPKEFYLLNMIQAVKVFIDTEEEEKEGERIRVKKLNELGLKNLTNNKEPLYKEPLYKNNSLCRVNANTARVSKKEINPEEEQTNPDKKQERLITRYKQFSTRLHEIVTAHRNITRAARPAGWLNHFRLLHERDGITIKRINTVLEWYADNIGGQYIPEAYSAASFREKFPKLEAAIERNSGKKKPSRQEKKQVSGNGAAPVPGKYGETGWYFWNYSNYCYDKDEKKVDSQHFTGWKKHPRQYTGPCGCDYCKRKGIEDLETITLTGGPNNDMDFQAWMEDIERKNE